MNGMKPWKARKFLSLLIAIGLVLLVFAGCIYPRPSRSAPGADQTPMFIPPELNPVTPTPETDVQPEGNSQVQGCINNLKFLTDTTIPDGTVAEVGEAMEKKWEVENNGTCNWVSGYSLRLIAGGSLGANPEQALIPALAGSKATIQINLLAPTVPGDYRSAWQAHGPDGQPFGDVIYVQISVN
jgi:hypothetical protein